MRLHHTLQDARDLKAVNKGDGKVPHEHDGQLLAPKHCPSWPSLPLSVRGRSDPFHADKLPGGVRARVVLARWRQSAEMYLAEWRSCVVKAFADVPEVDVLELNLIDVTV